MAAQNGKCPNPVNAATGTPRKAQLNGKNSEKLYRRADDGREIEY